jgi:hypothetical protein
MPKGNNARKRPRRRIDRFISEALEAFALWLKTNEWRGKEHDCVNLFAHRFLIEKVEAGAAIEDPAQISIECPLKQPKGYTNKGACKDLVIWKHPYETAWGPSWEHANSPKAVMEWKVFFKKPLPKGTFDKHDEEWIEGYTAENPETFGYVVSVDLKSDSPTVYWKQAKQGLFSKPRPL